MKFFVGYLLLLCIFITYVEYSVGNILYRPSSNNNTVINLPSLLNYLLHPLHNTLLWHVNLLDVNFIFWTLLYSVVFLLMYKKTKKLENYNNTN